MSARFFSKGLSILTLTSLLAGAAFAESEGWVEDFEAAKKTADTEGKDLLLNFTGSDWCGWCVKLDDEVFSKDAFKDYAKENLVLVELDYPRKKEQSEELKAQNKALKETYEFGGFPTIILTDATGRPYAQSSGYKEGGPDVYVDMLKELRKIHVERDRLFAEAEKAEGVEKAKLLHSALQALGMHIAINYYEETVKQIMTLDADGKAGLKKHYEDFYSMKALDSQIQEILADVETDPNGAIAKLDEILKQENLPVQGVQNVLSFKSQIQMFVLNDKVVAKATLIEAIAAYPESEMAEQLRAALVKFFPEPAASADAS